MVDWKTAVGIALLSLSTMGVALAQPQASGAKGGTPLPATTAPASAAVSNEPVQTTATYGDWLLRCFRTGEGGTGPQTCEVVQTLFVQGQQQPIAQVAIGSLDKTSGMRMTVVVPSAVSFSTVPSIMGTGTAVLFELKWVRCVQTTCFAETPLTPESLKTLRARSEPATLAFRDAGEHDVSLPFTMRGLTQALDALPK